MVRTGVPASNIAKWNGAMVRARHRDGLQCECAGGI